MVRWVSGVLHPITRTALPHSSIDSRSSSGSKSFSNQRTRRIPPSGCRIEILAWNSSSRMERSFTGLRGVDVFSSIWDRSLRVVILR